MAGLGGKDRRDGTFQYYMSEPVVKDDCKGSRAVPSCIYRDETVRMAVSVIENKRGCEISLYEKGGFSL